ncbi:MAG: hypothetical protein HW416_2729 [Chloroflexi bacterium]|nr:hypothetical protein [Chloroflexota bacterium]
MKAPTIVALAQIVVVASFLGCASTGPKQGRSEQATTPSLSPIKTLVVGQLNAVLSYGPWDFSNTSGGGSALEEVHTIGLTTHGRTSGFETRLAAGIPSLDDGSVVILPDGRMQTIWKLRSDVKWHDGTPFTAHDIAFTAEIATHPLLLSSREEHLRRAEKVEALDPLTVVVTWPGTYYRALELISASMWPFPRHILREPLTNIESRDAFLGQSYFTTEYVNLTTEYVNLGPFRLVDFGGGENQVFEAFDDYFLGRPKVDRLILRTIGEVNVMLANLRAGAIDMTSEKTLPLDVFLQLRDEWKQSGEGSVFSRQDNWRYLWFQFHPEYAKPIELSQDPRLRRGLLYGLDRDALRDLLMPGVENTSGDSFMSSADPRGATVGQPFSRYQYEPNRALQDFADGGWRRANDGRMLNRAGDQVQLEMRGNEPDEKEVAFISAGWRQLGFDVKEYIPPQSLSRDNEFKSKFPAMETRVRGFGDTIFISFDGRLGSGPQNRWQGANTAHYANPSLDALIDKLSFTFDRQEQGLVLRDMAEILAADLPALPVYWRTIFAAVSKNARAFTDDYPGTGTASMARNVHLWEKLS